MTPSAVHFDDLSWQSDELGDQFERADIQLGPDPEGEGEAVATLVRHLPGDSTGKPALLWVHGMTDYFFHDHVAEFFAAKKHPFYALDLRKCGRAHQVGQTWHYAEQLEHYFPELTAAVEAVAERHGSIVPIAHSTGGLIVPVWADHVRRTRPEVHAHLTGIVLNSAWLDMMYPQWALRIATPVIKFVGKLWPRIAIPGGNLGTYGKSIHSSAHGQWDFDLEKKPVGGHPKYLGWVRTIMDNQDLVHRGQIDAGVPVLSLCSSKSYLNKPYSAASNTADTVLDVEQIQRWSPRLSKDVRVVEIQGARHDVFLSLENPRHHAFQITMQWLDQLGD
ncbi:alpha/beta hydrolase [Corynebacterium cystitidis]|uniref:alpha/beta hydrolase n=1 Tax=Corynebacterium cystitidis TaxID=35757 RepID=UPI00211EE5FA|nr:alpha/beta hydrolase [Corynebacterium cystitidis]